MIDRNAEIAPFLMRFGKRVEVSMVTDPFQGRYNPRLQVWEYSDRLSKTFPVASFPAREGPPTVSPVVTWNAPPRLPQPDSGPDD